MSIASRDILTLDAGFNLASLKATINNACILSGFTAIDEYAASNEENLIYEFSSGNEIRAKTYYRIRISSTFQISHLIASDWNLSANTPTNASNLSNATTFNNSFGITFHCLNALPEYSAILLVQNSITQVLGVFNFQGKSPAWNLDEYTHAFIPASSNLATWNSSTLVPFSSNSFTLDLAGSSLISAESVILQSISIPIVLRLYSSTNGAYTQTSEHFGLAPTANRNRGLTFNPPSDSRLFLPLSYSNGGVVVQVNS